MAHKQFVVMANLLTEGWHIAFEESRIEEAERKWLEASRMYAGSEVVLFETVPEVQVRQILDEEREVKQRQHRYLDPDRTNGNWTEWEACDGKPHFGGYQWEHRDTAVAV